ncbi:hypothetical protein B9Z55_006814 [Caenorhabditis nigoni]|uniref:Receptor L-domain domain-containing protein n=1 Tax=Caenorhabditis nigoni TaxID=1611254 RepID=A0A2G5V6P9_9PELO|nr:hypothetical protein B9Z55_006814 [Caenorhabditis nigoni]
MKISIPVLRLAFCIVLIEAYASNVVPDKLHDEFHKISTSRLNHLKDDIPAHLYLSMLFLVNNCSTTGPPATKTISQQMILEETICGSTEMLNWCDENPERHVVLVTSNKNLKNKVFAQFQCGNSELKASPKRQLPLKLMVNCAAVLLVVSIIISWRAKLSRPMPLHPSNILNLSNKSDSDSFETVTLNSTKTTMSKSRITSYNLSTFSFTPKKFRIIV